MGMVHDDRVERNRDEGARAGGGARERMNKPAAKSEVWREMNEWMSGWMDG